MIAFPTAQYPSSGFPGTDFFGKQINPYPGKSTPAGSSQLSEAANGQKAASSMSLASISQHKIMLLVVVIGGYVIWHAASQRGR